MLADREDIRRAQYFNGGRIVIMAEYPLEKTTDVPVRVPKFLTERLHSITILKNSLEWTELLNMECFGIVPTGLRLVHSLLLDENPF